jgi:hypothetical protein
MVGKELIITLFHAGRTTLKSSKEIEAMIEEQLNY